jgi:hypothetical protein
MTVQDVQKMCNHAIKVVKERRQERADEMIAAYLGWRNSIRKFLKMRPLSPEDAASALRGGSTFNEFNTISWNGWGTMNTAKKLLALSEKSADGFVTVSSDDYDDLDV